MNRESKIAFKSEYLSLLESAYFFHWITKLIFIKRKTVIKVDWNKNDISLIIICNHEKISHPSFNIWQKHNFDFYILGL